MNRNLQKTLLLCLSFLTALTIKGADITATWNFQTMGAGTVSIEGNTGTVSSDVEGIGLTIDATAAGAKLQTRGSDAQFNKGTIIRVPVKTAHDIVTVTSYPGYHFYNVGNTAATANETRYNATSAEATQGYVEIAATGSAYLYNIRVVHVSMIQEKMLYSTTFTDWTDAAAKAEESRVARTTKYSHETLMFSVFNTQVSSTNQNPAKFPAWKGGYLMCAKSANPYIVTSPLADITKVHFLHGATGSNRGWKLEAKGDGDADWVVLSDAVATTASGTEVNADVNRTNCQLRFTNLNASQNAYLFQLDIYGNIDMGATPSLGTFAANGITYQAADIFHEDAEGTLRATIEISKSATMISADNPLTSLVAVNGEVGTVEYTVREAGTTATIPVTANGRTVTYEAIFVQKPDFTLTYFNTDGLSSVGTQTVEKDATIGQFQFSEADVTVGKGKKFRGWFAAANGSGNRKFTTSDVITSDTRLYAVVTDIETQNTTGRYTFSLTDPYFYDEDHEAFDHTGTGKFHDGTHGWQFANGDKVNLLVGGNAYIMAQLCRYGGAGTITVMNSKGEQLATIDTPVSNDGDLRSYYYEGPADILTLAFSGAPYVHAITIVNVQDTPVTRNEAGYYVVKAGDADNFLTTLEIANANAGARRTYIFLPKGTYHLGEKTLTPISGNNISIIGEDSESTVIVNAPKVENEGIGTTATLLITGENTYLQDLTLRNALDYYASGAAGRAVVIQDKGNRTICKNVRMLSYQDTYYSNNGGQYYFEDGEIHGTVDYICGNGDVYFNRVKLVNESRSANGKAGEDVIAAPYPSDNVQFGYVFNNCTIDNKAATFSLGRAWGGLSKLTFLNTTILQPAELAATRFTTGGMNTAAYRFKEYASVDADGSIVTPSDNTQTFKKDAISYTYNTTLTAEEAQAYAIDKVFPNWNPSTLAAQAMMGSAAVTGNTVTWDAVANAPAYAVFADGTFAGITGATSFAADSNVKAYTVRAANPMGGFGKAVTASPSTGIGTMTMGHVAGQTYYSVNGTKLHKPQTGVNIRISKLTNGTTVTEKVVVR